MVDDFKYEQIKARYSIIVLYLNSGKKPVSDEYDGLGGGRHELSKH